MPKMEQKVRKRFNFKDFPSLEVLEKSASVVLVNSDNAVDHPEPLQPNVVQIGGLQIIEPKNVSEVISFQIEFPKNFDFFKILTLF